MTITITSEQILELVSKMIKFPNSKICKHLVACDLLSFLISVGVPVSNELAHAVVNGYDEEALELIERLKCTG